MAELADPKQERFCQEKVFGRCSDAEAARRAGYSPDNQKNCNRSAYRIKQYPHVQERLAELYAKLEDEVATQGDKLRDFWVGTMESERNKMQDRLKASELLAKSLGLFIEKRENKNENSGVVELRWMGEDEDNDTV